MHSSDTHAQKTLPQERGSDLWFHFKDGLFENRKSQVVKLETHKQINVHALVDTEER
jgi:hypothetical protein